MTSRKRPRFDVRDLCAQTTPEDGIDPRKLDRQDRREDRKEGWRDEQFCKLVGRAVQTALQADATDRYLKEIDVLRVIPAPHLGRLRVEVAWSDPGMTREHMLGRLDRARGFLRTAIAPAIARKRVPELVFAVGTPESGVTDE